MAADGTTGGAVERLGTVKAIDNNTTIAQLGDVLGEHRAAVLEVANDSQRLRERVDRMIPQAEALLRKAQAEGRAEWVPGGSREHAERRYLAEDGSVRLGRTSVTFNFPDGTTGTEVRHGLLSEPYPVCPEQEQLRRAFAAFAIAHTFARHSGRGWTSPLLRKAWTNFRRAAMDFPGRIGEWFTRVFTDAEMYKRVVSNTAGTGGELIAVPTIADIRRPTDLARRVAGLVPQLDVQASSFKAPIVTGRALSRRRGGTTNDPAKYPVQTFTTSDETIAVVDRVAQALLDDNYETEAALILGDPAGFAMDWLESGDADTLEIAFIHGDTAATHQDTIATWTLGSYYTAGDLDGTSSPLKFWIGIRARAHDDSNTVAGGGSFDATDHFTAINALGTLGAGAVALTGLRNFYLNLMANSLFASYDKFGPAATLLTGSLVKIGDTDLVWTQFLSNEYASSGLFTGSGTTNIMPYFQPKAFRHYVHDGGQGMWDEARPEAGARYIGFKRRSVLKPWCLSTEKPASVIVNL